MTGRLLDPHTREVQDNLIIQKYNFGWPYKVISGYLGVSTDFVNGRVEELRKKGLLGRRRKVGHKGN